MIPLVLALGTLFGLAQGAMIHFFKAPPFIVTLAGMFLLRGLAFVVNLASVPIDDPFFARLSALSIPITEKASLSFNACVLIVAVAAAAVVLGYTRFGRNVYAVGGGEQSVLLMGLPLGRTKLAIYALSGFFSAAAGVVFSVYTLAGSASAAMGLEMETIAAVVIGGTLLSGGFGFVAGSLVGALIQGLIQTLIAFQGTLDVSWTKIFVGSLLLAFILLQRFFSQGGKSSRVSAARAARRPPSLSSLAPGAERGRRPRAPRLPSHLEGERGRERGRRPRARAAPAPEATDREDHQAHHLPRAAALALPQGRHRRRHHRLGRAGGGGPRRTPWRRRWTSSPTT